MSIKTKRIGDIGEELACGYLGGKGYKILERNFRTVFGEIDIIAKSPLKTLTFIEVKTIKLSSNFIDSFPESYPHFSGNINKPAILPEDNLSTTKLLKFRKIAQWYANNNQNLCSHGYQLDAVCITVSPDHKPISIKHFENV